VPGAGEPGQRNHHARPGLADVVAPERDRLVLLDGRGPVVGCPRGHRRVVRIDDPLGVPVGDDLGAERLVAREAGTGSDVLAAGRLDDVVDVRAVPRGEREEVVQHRGAVVGHLGGALHRLDALLERRRGVGRTRTLAGELADGFDVLADASQRFGRLEVIDRQAGVPELANRLDPGRVGRDDDVGVQADDLLDVD